MSKHYSFIRVIPLLLVCCCGVRLAYENAKEGDNDCRICRLASYLYTNHYLVLAEEEKGRSVYEEDSMHPPFM
jgi:hypothetical protein